MVEAIDSPVPLAAVVQHGAVVVPQSIELALRRRDHRFAGAVAPLGRQARGGLLVAAPVGLETRVDGISAVLAVDSCRSRIVHGSETVGRRRIASVEERDPEFRRNPRAVGGSIVRSLVAGGVVVAAQRARQAQLQLDIVVVREVRKVA